MATSKQSYKINVKHPVYAVMTSDDTSATVYGAVKKFGEAQQVTLTPSVSTGNLYGNGSKVDSAVKMTGITVAYKATKIPIEVKADLYNYTMTSGVMDVTSVQPNYIAFGYEVEQTSGDSEYVWLLKGRPQPITEDVTQSEDNITYSTDTINIEFVERLSDNVLYKFADAANADFTGASTWFDAVPV